MDERVSFSEKRLSQEPEVAATSEVKKSKLGKWTSIGERSTIEEATIGDYTYTAGDNQIIYSDIGKFTSIASHVRINPGNHPTWRVMQHHATYRRVNYGFADVDDDHFFNWRREHKVTIGHDVWIGHNAIIMPGVTIGTGAVIGSGAIVTKDIPPYMVAVGVPAKPIKERFPKAIADQMLQIAWWDWSREELEERIDDFNDLNVFIEKYGK